MVLAGSKLQSGGLNEELFKIKVYGGGFAVTKETEDVAAPRVATWQKKLHLLKMKKQG